MIVDIEIINNSSYRKLPKKKVAQAIKNVFRYGKKGKTTAVSIIYVNDDAIMKINKKYLKHNRATDVITFSLGENDSNILGEIYISAETAIRQASEYNVSISNEIMRLAIHGALHLAGYNDDTEKKRLQMHELENKYLGMI